MIREGSSYGGTDSIACESHMAPYDHVASLASKNMRAAFANAINHRWVHLPDAVVSRVVAVIEKLHNASLLVDDIEDGATLRRGAPAAHRLYGVGLTLNSANQAYFEAMAAVMALPHSIIADARAAAAAGEDDDPAKSAEASDGERVWSLQELGAFCERSLPQLQVALTQLFTEEMIELHEGQGMDILWRDTLTCPTVDEYTTMVLKKTGGLFRLALRLLLAMQPEPDAARDKQLVALVCRIGIFFQKMDDYLNVVSTQYHTNKSFFEDLSEGKFSYPIILAIRAGQEKLDEATGRPDRRLFHILKQHTEDEQLKLFAVRLLEDSGAMAQCKVELERENAEIDDAIARLGGCEPLAVCLRQLWKLV